jgi:hypothetical protein
MKTACHYAIVRFLPFVETGEFANVGVVLFAPGMRYFGFRLLGNRQARVTHFFERLDPKIFRVAMKTCQEELQRIEAFVREASLDRMGMQTIWGEIVKPRESILRFGDARMVLTDNPQVKVQELYEHYVEHAFVTPEREEALLERAVRGWLRDAKLKDRFRAARIGNEEYNAHFPFVAGPEDQPERAIKPLSLAQTESAQIIDHGGQWVMRIRALKKRDLLPGRVLFAVKGGCDDTACGRARHDVVQELEENGVLVVSYGDNQQLIQFAS